MVENRFILTEYDSPLGVISLNRPKNLNAMKIEMMEELLEALQRMEQDEKTYVIAIKGEGRVFSAGGDIEVMRESNINGTLDKVEKVTRKFQEVIKHIRSSKKLFISLVHGAAMGGGSGLALAADLVYVQENTKFGWPYAGLGLGPDGGASYELHQALGRYKTLETLLFNRNLTPEEMLNKGLINEIISQKEWEEKTENRIQEICRYDAAFLSYIKDLLRGMNQNQTAQQLALEYQIMVATAELPYHREQVAELFKKKEAQSK